MSQLYRIPVSSIQRPHFATLRRLTVPPAKRPSVTRHYRTTAANLVSLNKAELGIERPHGLARPPAPRRAGWGVQSVVGLVSVVGILSAVGLVSGAKPYATTVATPTSPSTLQQPPLTPIASYDVIVVGSGAAAMTGALRAKALGLSTLIVEKSPRVGGTSAYSGGGLWVPNSHVWKAYQEKHPETRDSVDEALLYMETLIGDVGPASSRERKLAFLTKGPEMVEFLEGAGFNWIMTVAYPDYYPNLPGGKKYGGRSIEGRVFDLKQLGPWMDKLNMNPQFKGVPMYTHESAKLFRTTTLAGIQTAMKVFIWRRTGQQLLGRTPVTLGPTLTGQLLLLTVKNDIPIWLNTPMKDIVVEDGVVTGVLVEKDNETVLVEAKKGVLLAAGGFAHNAAMRQKYQENPITSDWTLVPQGIDDNPPADQGDAITVAMKAGAATALMDDAWWGPTILDPREKNKRHWCHTERALPHSICVDQNGNRFGNEAISYTTFGQNMYKRNREAPCIPAYFVADSVHRRKYLLAGMMPRLTPQSAIDSGFIYKADTIKELAEKMGVDPQGLESTVSRFNGMVSGKGVDEDFRRGENTYEHMFGDKGNKPNPNLGTIAKPPFYGAKLWPGDLGTKGGILTDQYARAIKEDGSVIKGLYAAGNSSASVMGRHYAGAGSTLGPGMTFAYAAMDHVASGK